MKRNMFGDEQPETFDDLVEIRNSYGFNPASAYVTVADGSADNSPDSNFHGWCAEISVEVEQEGDEGVELEQKEFSTCAWKSKDDLLADLAAAGFKKVEVQN